MSSRASRLRIFDALTVENPPPIPLNDETVIFSLPEPAEFEAGVGNEEFWNTAIVVTAKEGSGYTGSVEIFYTRLELSQLDDGVEVVNEYPYSLDSLVTALNRKFDSFLTVDDLETVEVLAAPTRFKKSATLRLTARQDSLGWIGSVTLDVSNWAANVPNQDQDLIGRTYHYELSDVWKVKHDLNTTNLIGTIRDVTGRLVFAHIEILNENEFQVEFTEPEAGCINVVFFMHP